ncbi:hypothetical protein QJS10_CPA07g00823 [Acorus calamus]|uniref:Reverse transcriptase zinc-binding domain-containing protein n=1 Tax=Acorus calamus TaxID=4465 RepID=A0AAV9EGS6_ACOCL|nr:hypothetical protein QJS10_CPA07g00823 [Acorus calamus]
MQDKTKLIWKGKYPLKVKIFCWMALQGRLLTKVYKSKWRQSESTMCALCQTELETVEHLLLKCVVVAPGWVWLSAASGIHFRCNTLEELWEDWAKSYTSKDRSCSNRVSQLTTPAALWAIWLTRNSCVFKGQRFYVENLCDLILQFIQSRGTTLAGAGSVRLHRGVLHIGG